MGAGLTFLQYEASCSPNGAPTTPVGGSWPAGTICVHVVPTYHPTASYSDIDYLAWDRSSPANWSNVALALNDQLVVPFNTPTRGTGGNRIYDMSGFALYYQAAATPTWTNAWTRIAVSTNPFATSITATSNASLGTTTANATSTTFAAERVLDIPNFKIVPKVAQTYSGTILRRTLINRAAVREVEIIVPGGALTHSRWSRLLKWISAGTFIRLYETQPADAEADAPIEIYEGVLINTNYINSQYKNRRTEYSLGMLVESTTASSLVP